MSALILDGHLKSALSAVRSLGERKIRVCVGSERKTGMALHSRYVRHDLIYPSPRTHEAAFLDAVEKEARRMGDKPVIYAFGDATLLALYRARERFAPSATLVFPDERAMEIAFDKAVTYSLARVSNIPTILTYTPATPTELAGVGEKIAYPAVLKPRKSMTIHNGISHFESAVFVHSKAELISVYGQMRERLGEAPLIQERIIGEEYGVEMIAHEGDAHTFVVHHRLRSLSPTGGASVLKETVEAGALRDMLLTYARKMVHELNWTGPVMVEFKVNGDTMTPLLMEVNGRFWGSLPLSIAAGVDMPYIFYILATTELLPKESIEPKEGVITRHFWGDVRHLLRVMFARDQMRKHMYPKRKEALRLFLHPPKGTRGDVWSISDPKPAIIEFLDILSRSWK